jgi:hypothetical protein
MTTFFKIVVLTLFIGNQAFTVTSNAMSNEPKIEKTAGPETLDSLIQESAFYNDAARWINEEIKRMPENHKNVVAQYLYFNFIKEDATQAGYDFNTHYNYDRWATNQWPLSVVNEIMQLLASIVHKTNVQDNNINRAIGYFFCISLGAEKALVSHFIPKFKEPITEYFLKYFILNYLSRNQRLELQNMKKFINFIYYALIFKELKDKRKDFVALGDLETYLTSSKNTDETLPEPESLMNNFRWPQLLSL